ncbi:peroxiredoxin-like family protein [Microtetraspora niveoalba]|uniref:peroxiredoxin-like family protein n=1 Tax=Microtetraspora niveoalba TaxID=46175 RepID=UPI0009FF67B3|nr:peroxiredoxin-like family protein [Microtetraspora niveoalba]
MCAFRRAMEPGSAVSARQLTAVSGGPVAIPDDERLIHLQFRRFAGCPVCNLHLRSVVRRHDEIEAAGVREVVVFHSSAEELAEHTSALPFAVIADPGKRLYVEFGVESARRSLLDPRVWGPIVGAVALSAWGILRGRERGPAARPHGGRFGLPADFLIGRDGRVLAAKYGEHAYDQWSVDELLDLASGSPSRPGPARSDAARSSAPGSTGSADISNS